MKIKYLTVFLLASLLVLTACEEEAAGPPTGKAFIGGTDGLVVSFEPISVKEEGLYSVYDEDTFSLELTLRNRGEETIKKGDASLELFGVPKDDFSGVTWEKKSTVDLEKISEFNPYGGEETISFAEDAQYTKEVITAVDFAWNLKYDYKYKTYLIIDDVCFKEDPLDPAVCTIKEPRTFSVSSAPITVISVGEDVAGKGVMALLIEVKNAGQGKSTLVGEDFDIRFDQLAFEVDEPQKWECKSGAKEGYARLDKETRTALIRCKLKEALEEGTAPYTAPVKLTFEYLYQDSVVEKLRIKESQK